MLGSLGSVLAGFAAPLLLGAAGAAGEACPCPDSPQPAEVCTDAGDTYESRCQAECHGQVVQCDGQCPCGPKSCPCPRWHSPVCAADGETYENSCQAQCQSQAVLCEGGCPCSNATTPQGCPCPPDLVDPVCSTEGYTFQNTCQARCRSKEVACNGECPCAGDECPCPSNFSPVCGANGETYVNECGARCHKQTVACQGACPCANSSGAPRSCPCPEDSFDRVCATDGRTYDNECQVRCQNQFIMCSGECPCKTSRSEAKSLPAYLPYVTDDDRAVARTLRAFEEKACSSPPEADVDDRAAESLLRESGGRSSLIRHLPMLLHSEEDANADGAATYVSEVLAEQHVAVPLGAGAATLLVWCLALCQYFRPGCRCLQQRRSAPLSFKLAVWIVLLILSGLIIFIGIQEAMLDAGGVRHGMDSFLCTSKEFASATLSGSGGKDAFPGTLEILSDMQDIAGIFNEGSAFSQKMSVAIDHTTDVYKASLVAVGTLHLLDSLHGGLTDPGKCPLCEEMDALRPAALEELERGAAFRLGRLRVSPGPSREQEDDFQYHVGLVARPLVDFKDSMVVLSERLVHNGGYSQLSGATDNAHMALLLVVLFSGVGALTVALCGCSSAARFACCEVVPAPAGRDEAVPLVGAAARVSPEDPTEEPAASQALDSQSVAFQAEIDAIRGQVVRTGFGRVLWDFFVSPIERAKAFAMDAARVPSREVVLTSGETGATVQVASGEAGAAAGGASRVADDVAAAAEEAATPAAYNARVHQWACCAWCWGFCYCVFALALGALATALLVPATEGCILLSELTKDSSFLHELEAALGSEETATLARLVDACILHTEGSQSPLLMDIIPADGVSERTPLRAKLLSDIGLAVDSVYGDVVLASPAPNASLVGSGAVQALLEVFRREPATLKSQLANTQYGCDLFEWTDKNVTLCDPKDVTEPGGCLAGSDGQDYQAMRMVRSQRHCGRTQYVEYLRDFEARLSGAVSRLDEAFNASAPRVAAEFTRAYSSSDMDAAVDSMAAKTDCRYFREHFHALLDGMCHQALLGVHDVADAYMFCGLCTSTLAFAMFLLWRVAVDNYDMQAETPSG